MTVKQQNEQNRLQLIEGLRRLADIYEQNPQLKAPVWKQDITVWVSPREERDNPEYVKEMYREFLNVLGGTDKDTNDFTFEMQWEFGMMNLRLCTDRENVCEKVVTGTKIIPAKEEYVVPAQDERIEEVYEWKCSPLLK